jgi:hypothetical protein
VTTVVGTPDSVDGENDPHDGLAQARAAADEPLPADFRQQLGELLMRVDDARGRQLSAEELEAVADLVATLRALLGEDDSD